MSNGNTVFLTGASGFIAKHIALQLLDSGYTVHGSIRTPRRADEIAEAVKPHLPATLDLADRLKFVELDLLSDAGWKAALDGADILVHTASPFPIQQPKDENDVIRPAVDGTLRALKAAKEAGIRRVVLTSSIVAVSDDFDIPEGRIFDEDSWTNVDNPAAPPYAKSKTLAERAAWDFVRDEAPEMQLTVINPAFVLGPPLDRHFGSSMSILQRVVRSKDPALPQIGWSVVDVRDVAAMHVHALSVPASIGHRFIASSGYLWLRDMARVVADEFPRRRIVTRRAPDFVVRLLALFDNDVKAAVPVLNLRREFSSARARDVFNMDFTSAEEAVRAAARFLVENDLV